LTLTVAETLTVEVGEDHLAGWVRNPRTALAELIWNALDADARRVEVIFELNAFDGVDAVIVRDDGTGMTAGEAAFGFRNFGNSWKRMATTTKEGRSIHGKFGRGRYTAFSIGDHAAWESIAVDDDGRTSRVRVTGRRSRLKQFELDDPYEVNEPAGTIVKVSELSEKAQRVLLQDDIGDELTTRFALFLSQYPDVKIVYRGKRLDPQRLQERVTEYPIPVPGSDGVATLVVIEWKAHVDRQLYLCDEHGAAISETKPGVRAGGFEFTAYLRWAGFRDMGHNVLLADLGGEGSELIDAAKEQLREHFRNRALDRQREVIAAWEAEGTYPYAGEPATPTEAVEREAFDFVALAAAKVVNDTPEKARRLSLRLIKTALETSPQALHDVLRDVLELPADRIEELAELLERTTLGNIITAANRIAARLDFLSGLDALIFDAEPRAQTLERRQLHRILANETWVFGEEWALTGDDERLTRVLQKFLGLLGDDVELASLDPVLREDGRDAIPDLVLSRSLATAQDQWQFLVVELKRPSHVLTPDDVEQLRSYAGAVSRDERFQQPNVSWDFWLVGNSISADVDEQRDQVNLPHGVVMQTKRYTIWVKTWAEVIGTAQYRLRYVRESLDYSTSRDQGVRYLRQRHAEFLPPVLQAEADPAPAR
jgi:hypothetical protein